MKHAKGERIQVICPPELVKEIEDKQENIANSFDPPVRVSKSQIALGMMQRKPASQARLKDIPVDTLTSDVAMALHECGWDSERIVEVVQGVEVAGYHVRESNLEAKDIER